MLSRETILKLFSQLNEKLREKHERGEIGIVGGAAMCLAYRSRQSTNDVDAIFAPASTIRVLAKRVAEENGIEGDWLNDGAKAFLVEGFQRIALLNLSHLVVWTPEARYLLAMKCLSARWDSFDRNDVGHLIQHLGISKKEEVFRIIEKYYPRERIPAKTKYFVEEILERKRHKTKRG